MLNKSKPIPNNKMFDQVERSGVERTEEETPGNKCFDAADERWLERTDNEGGGWASGWKPNEGIRG